MDGILLDLFSEHSLKTLISSCASIKFMGESTWLKKVGELLRIYVPQ